MNKQLENKRTMYEGLLAALRGNSEAVGGVGGFAESVAAFGQLLDSINAKAKEVDHASAGKTDAKADAEEALVEQLVKVSSALTIYARRQKDAELRKKVFLPESEFRRARDTELVTMGSGILALVEEHATGLAGLGIPAEEVTKLGTRLETYRAALGNRESGVAQRVGARAALDELFAQADEMIREELDQFAELARGAFPQFYEEYHSARMIKDLGMRRKPKPEGAAV